MNKRKNRKRCKQLSAAQNLLSVFISLSLVYTSREFEFRETIGIRALRSCGNVWRVAAPVPDPSGHTATALAKPWQEQGTTWWW
jgi:hypothetical protein